MDGMTLLEQARKRGLIVMAEGNRLKIRGPKRLAPIARRLICQKVEVMAALRADAFIAEIEATDPGLAVRLRDLWMERMAICQIDGGLTPEEAERVAWGEIMKAAEEHKSQIRTAKDVCAPA